jgi:hypothetical protein
MDIEEIQENNKLIGEFMGLIISNRENYDSQLHTNVDADLKFHSSWDWLMPVVEKIELIETIDVDILQNGTRIYEWRSGGLVIADNVANISYDRKIEHTYDAVIQFIKWFNENN